MDFFLSKPLSLDHFYYKMAGKWDEKQLPPKLFEEYFLFKKSQVADLFMRLSYLKSDIATKLDTDDQNACIWGFIASILGEPLKSRLFNKVLVLSDKERLQNREILEFINRAVKITPDQLYK